jgi:hypothetical protein
MTSESDLVRQGRAAIDTVAERVKGDAAYAARFKDEPVSVLLEAGAPAEGLVDILRETGFDEGDVSGYLASLNLTPGLNLPTAGPGLRAGPAGLRGGTLADCTTSCSGTCNCSSSCLFTF